jgi:DNA-binding CsgD family transcriptional regulator
MVGIRWCAIDIQPLVSSAILPDNAFFRKYKLRPRDKEILLLMLKGFKTKEIAARLFISEGTVKFHINTIYKVFGVKNKEGFLEVIRSNQVSRFGYEPFFYSIIARILKD